MTKKKYVIAALAIGGFYLATMLASNAQQQRAASVLEVSPPSQEFQINPGETKTITAKIRNRSNGTVPITVTIEDITASGDEGQVALVDKGPYAVSAYTTVSPSSFTLAPNEQKEVTATIALPSTGVAGGKYGSFVFSIQAPDVKGKNAAAISQQVASLFLLRVTGPVAENLMLTKMTAPAFSEFGPIAITMNFFNNGNVHTKVYGIVAITDMFGNKVTDIVVDAKNVFPGANRTITASLDKNFLFGRYTATAIMQYGNDKPQALGASTSFIVIPVRIIAIILALIVVLFVLRKRIAKALSALSGK